MTMNLTLEQMTMYCMILMCVVVIGKAIRFTGILNSINPFYYYSQIRGLQRRMEEQEEARFTMSQEIKELKKVKKKKTQNN